MDDQAQGGPDEATSRENAVRAPYSRPVLKVYGTIASLTRTVGMNGTTTDGGKGGGMSKTS